MINNRIHKLSPLLINQIAAGEVVTRPASVVKELLENAIDAKANKIRIDIEQGGLGLIKVSDNGCGIHPDDMILAVTRHATSKLADVGELTGINSLGFRGEALASIAGVAHLSIISSSDNTGVGRQLTLSGDDASHAHITPVVKEKGTTVSVRDLYFNVPARRNHLKSISTEFSHIEQIVQKIAISFADIHIELYHQNKLRLNLEPTACQSLQRLENSLSKDLRHTAKTFELSLTGLWDKPETIATQPKITGFLWVNEPNPIKFVYINKRLVTDFSISQVLQKVARKLSVEQLGYVLFFDLPTDWINVNIHPSKQQVKIQPLTNILAWLEQAVFDNLKAEFLIDNQINLKKSNHQHDVYHQDVLKKPIHKVSEKQSSYVLATPQTNVEQSLVKCVDDLPIVLSVIEKLSNKIIVLHYQDNLYLMDSCYVEYKNVVLNIEYMTAWLMQKFGQGNVQQLQSWLNNAKKIDYKNLI